MISYYIFYSKYIDSSVGKVFWMQSKCSQLYFRLISLISEFGHVAGLRLRDFHPKLISKVCHIERITNSVHVLERSSLDTFHSRFGWKLHVLARHSSFSKRPQKAILYKRNIKNFQKNIPLYDANDSNLLRH